MADYLRYEFDSNDDYIFLRDVLKKELEISQSLLAKLKNEHRIMVNGQQTLTNYRLQPGDVVTVDIALEENNYIPPIEMPLDIIYEDQDLLVVNKPPGISVHPVKDLAKATLAHAVSYYWQQKDICSVFRPINRLDRNTSGLVVIGRSQYAHQALFQQMKQGDVHRSYLALAEGEFPHDSMTIELPIAHPDPGNDPRRAVDAGGKKAVTDLRVIRRYKGYTLLELSLHTGRTHQIRVHLSYLGYPVCGDNLYGKSSCMISRQALHAYHLTLKQPRHKDPLQFTAPLPADMAALIRQIDLL
ncbi:MAG: RluA family pseudouridine synthase [Deltaproteobacteria bacterium]